MSRNFSFRSAPVGGQRAGRFSAVASVNIGSAVVTDGSTDADGGLAVVAAGVDATVPANGEGGLAVYEALFTDGPVESPSDVIASPAGAKLQVVSGDQVKVVLTNSADLAIVDVSGLAVGDPLSPAAAGTWASATNAWMTVTSIDATVSGEEIVEARLTF